MFDGMSFHEAEVVDIEFDGRDFRLRLDGISTDSGFISALLEFKNVSRLEIDDELSGRVEKHLDEGDILHADITEKKAKILFTWFEYENHREMLEEYVLEFEEIKTHKYPDPRDRTGWDDD